MSAGTFSIKECDRVRKRLLCKPASGTWLLGRPPATSPGLLIHIMADSVAAMLDAVIAHGGELVQSIGGDAPEITARFRDPAGNVFGVHQEPGSPSPAGKQ